MKTIAAALGAGLIAAAMMAGPAQARCLWDGQAWQCWRGHQHHAQIRADRHRLRQQRAEIRHDRRHLRHLHARLRHDMHVGSSSAVEHDRRALHRAQRELRMDRRDLRDARRELRQDRLGY
ncbi:MAG: hypothetical protein ACM3JG_01855 [Thiohalocapsa sp.]